MKKILLSLLVVSTSLFSAPTFYQEQRELTKEAMYHAQSGLMEQDKYLEFIEPHLQEAEKTLQALQYCQESPGSDACRQYLAYLRRYNVVCFRYLLSPKTVAIEQHNANLIKHIKAIKDEGKLDDLDVQQELEKTFKLTYEANKKYCKRLKLGTRISLWFGSFLF